MSSLEYQESVSPEIEAEMIEALEDLGQPPEAEKPKARRRAKPDLTIRVLEGKLREQKIEVRLNQITHEIEFSGLDSKYNPESSIGDLAVILHDDLKVKYRSSKDTVLDNLRIIAGKHRFNPVLDYLRSLAWDGEDHVKELYSILNIGEEDTLSKSLIYKWLCQCVALVQNDPKKPFGADGVLVINGPQGIGKTTLGRVLGTEHGFFEEGMFLDTRDKDTARRCVGNWLIEFGELETTFRSDLERLKSFITASYDTYRLPYGRTDERHVRRTSIIATCNTADFLIDPTGSRRFWTVPVETIDLDLLQAFDVDGLWSQIYHDVQQNGLQCFRLTKLEQSALALRNSQHEKPLKAETEIRDILDDVESKLYNYSMIECSVSEWQSYYAELSKYSAVQVGKVLKKLGIEQSSGRTKGRKYMLPIPNRGQIRTVEY